MKTLTACDGCDCFLFEQNGYPTTEDTILCVECLEAEYNNQPKSKSEIAAEYARINNLPIIEIRLADDFKSEEGLGYPDVES